ncbi:MAG: cytochrome P450, partial [Acidimicrobiales bacterium]
PSGTHGLPRGIAVPRDDRTVDIDVHAEDFLANRGERYADLRHGCPVAWNEHRSGFWIVTDYESVAAVARDNETFAHRYEPEPQPDGFRYRGIMGASRPPGATRQGVSETDGREHADIRRTINPFLTPQRVEQLRGRTRALSEQFVAPFVDAGEGDLVLDFASPVPATLTLELMGMASDNWRYYAEFFHAVTSYPKGSTELDEAMSHWPAMMGEIQGHARHRRSHPADDITTALVTAEIDGRLLSDAEVGDIMWNLIAGGIDTTTSLVGWGLHHLGTHPADRDRLVADRSLIPAAVEEFLRYFSPNEALTRTATRDVELNGASIKRGDLVLISWVSANHDETEFEAPDQVVIDRPVNKHLAFGLGGHRCIGSTLARMEAEVMFDVVLERVPDYELDLDRFVPAPPSLLMTAVVSLPATFPSGGRPTGAPSPEADR